jgi:hypothetical protein
MENAPTTNSSESAPDKRDYTPGELLKRIDTVRAAALAAMLEGADLTGMDSVFKHSTTRLSAVIHALTNRYGWQFERRDFATGTSDGRTAWISMYWLPQETIAQAFEDGAREWIERVKVARAERRKNANKCKASAAKKNAARARLRKQDPRQGAFWGDQ